MPNGVTLNGVSDRTSLDPEGKERIEEEVIALIAVENVFRVQRLESLLDGGGRT